MPLVLVRWTEKKRSSAAAKNLPTIIVQPFGDRLSRFQLDFRKKKTAPRRLLTLFK